jgi:hypothetical protein
VVLGTAAHASLRAPFYCLDDTYAASHRGQLAATIAGRAMHGSSQVHGSSQATIASSRGSAQGAQGELV